MVRGSFLSIELDALPDADLQGHWLRGTEYVSRPFRFTVEASSTNRALRIDHMVSSAVTIAIRTRDGKPRYIHGHVARVQQLGTALRNTRYRLLIVPWTSLLRRTRHCRIFQGELTISDILKEICKDYPIAHLQTDRLRTQPAIRRGCGRDQRAAASA